MFSVEETIPREGFTSREKHVLAVKLKKHSNIQSQLPPLEEACRIPWVVQDRSCQSQGGTSRERLCCDRSQLSDACYNPTYIKIKKHAAVKRADFKITCRG